MRIRFYFIMISLITFSVVKLSAQVRLGAEAGVNLTSLGVRGNHKQVLPVGGLTIDCQLGSKMMLLSGLHYTMKGANGLVDGSRELMVRLGYLELPVMFGYRIPIVEHISLIPQVGAYFACGVNGYGEFGANFVHTGIGKTDGIWYNPFKKFDLKTGKEEYIEPFERFDAGLRFAVSVEVYKFNLSLSHDLGLKRTWNEFDPDHYFKYKNRSVAITLGYKFSL
ncbi:outer membrane beta-barrel protein [Parabacteroides sp.]